MSISQTRGQFKASVWESLENDPRFEALLNEACSRAVEEIYCESNFGNFEHETLSVKDKEEYNLPEGSLFVNHVTYDGAKLERITFDEWLTAKTWYSGLRLRWRGGQFLVKDNRDVILSPPPGDNGKKIKIYISLTDDGFTDDNTENPMPIGIAYTKAAWHFARSFLLASDGQDERAQIEEGMFQRYMGKTNRRLNGSTKTKVRRVN